MRKVIGLDLYNQNITGGVAKTLTCMRVDVSNIPCVIVGGVLHTGREDGPDIHPQRCSEYPRSERLQTATGGDI